MRGSVIWGKMENMGNRPNISIKCWGKDGEVIGQVSGGRSGLRSLPSLGHAGQLPEWY